MKYLIYHSLHEEASTGWVWLSQPRFERRIIRILNEKTAKVIFCEYRLIDENFKKYYNSRPHTIDIPMAGPDDIVVISHWYRRMLCINETNGSVDLNISPTSWRQFGAIRAGWQHLDAIVRLAAGSE
jgi:hypothetical protein